LVPTGVDGACDTVFRTEAKESVLVELIDAFGTAEGVGLGLGLGLGLGVGVGVGVGVGPVPTQLLGALLTAIAMLPSAGADDVALTEHGTALWRKLLRKLQLPLRLAVVWPIA